MPSRKEKRLDWSLRADRERFEAWDYIFKKDRHHINADMVYARITHSVELLSGFPDMGKPWIKGRRLLFVPRTDYTIVYKVMAASIRILRISHQKKKTP